MGKTTIVLADDHTVVRTALRMLLEAEPEFEVVAEAGDAPNAVRYVRGHKPTVLILDLNMPGRTEPRGDPGDQGGLAETRVVVLTMQAETGFRARGPSGRSRRLRVQGGRRRRAGRGRPECCGRRDTYLQPAPGSAPGGRARRRRADDLSEREIEVLRKIALGYTNAEIAEQLFLSVRTVESHRAHIQQKLGAHDPVGAGPLRPRSRAGRDRRLDDRGSAHSNGKLGPDLGSLPGGRGDVDVAADQLEAFSHSDEPEPFGRGGRIEADAVVAHADRDGVLRSWTPAGRPAPHARA